MESTEESIRDILDTMKTIKTHVIGVTEGKRR